MSMECGRKPLQALSHFLVMGKHRLLYVTPLSHAPSCVYTTCLHAHVFMHKLLLFSQEESYIII